jgi:mRNA interferase MazF
MKMKQGDIWYVNLNPVEGSEQAGYHPVLVISGNLLNEHAQVVIGIPLTTKIKNYHGNLVLTPSETNGLKQTSEVMTLHIQSISKSRLKEYIGSISKSDIQKVVTCLNEIMTY